MRFVMAEVTDREGNGTIRLAGGIDPSGTLLILAAFVFWPTRM
jgi:hypothetical protein